MSQKKLLFLEDESQLRKHLAIALRENGFEVFEAGSLNEANDLISEMSFDLAILDKSLPEGEAYNLVLNLIENFPSCPIIILTGDDDEKSLCRYLEAGVADYIVKGSSVVSDVLIRIQHVFRIFSKQAQRDSSSRHQLHSLQYEINGMSPQTVALRNRVLQLKGINSSILILGETGTGKELVARMLNSIEPAPRPLVCINCGALPENLAESELFGHVRGAFTGATHNRIGAFELANNGDLFLDEVAELSPQMQVKLLRVLNNGEYNRVGESVSRRSNARVISATHRDLRELVRDGLFREDLYYRLNVIELRTTPLRDRPQDIADIARFLVLKLSKGRLAITEGAISSLSTLRFSGNVRELKNTLERAILSARIRDSAIIETEDLGRSPLKPLTTPTAQFVISAEGFVDMKSRAESTYLRTALEICPNRSELAKKLGISRAKLFTLLKKYSISESYNRQSHS